MSVWIYLRISSSLNGLESAISSGGRVKPVKENERPKLALEARLRATPLPTSSTSTFNWALLAFLMYVFLPPPPPPGDGAAVILQLDFLDRAPPPSADGGDFSAVVATVSTASWSDFVLAKLDDVLAFSMLPSHHHHHCIHQKNRIKLN